MAPDQNTRNWQNALAACDSLQWDGLSDWRLPSINELLSLVDYDSETPCQYRGGCPINVWSSTTFIRNAARAWVIQGTSSLTESIIKTDNKTLKVLCVRP